jgi:hypothetical protein
MSQVSSTDLVAVPAQPPNDKPATIAIDPTAAKLINFT